MVFVARLKGNGLVVPVKAYLHESGYERWGNTKTATGNAGIYIQKIFKSEEFLRLAKREELDYVISALWNNNGKKTADVFGYSGLREDWKANPEIIAWNCVNGVWQSPARFCGDTVVLLGEEETWRISGTKDLAYYAANPPNLSSRIWRPINERGL